MHNDGSPLLNALNTIIEDEPIDVLAFAEYQEFSDALKELLVNKKNYSCVERLSTKQEKVEVYYNSQNVSIEIARNGERATALKLKSQSTGKEINGFFCHLRSKYLTESPEQRELAVSYMEEVVDYEEFVKNDNTFICGDFNMSPYEEGMVFARGFHSIMDSEVVREHTSRNYGLKSYKTFYNPMWGLAGDLNGVPGTYYYKESRASEYYWYIFDQVILRPSIISYFDKSKLRVVTRMGEHNLLDTQGKVNLDYSDHLPICFTLNF